MKTDKVRLEFTHEGQVARIVLTAPKANIVDSAMMAQLQAAFSELPSSGSLKAVVLASDGAHFSFGASVEEHLPEHISGTLKKLGSLLRTIAATPAPTIAAVHGQCLGGALELALACDIILADETAQFALPEIKLGVFPPAGAALLPMKIGAARAAELILTGENWSATRAASAGLVRRVFTAGQLESKMYGWLEEDFLPRSPVALRFAAQAARRPLVYALEHDLPELEELYLDELMAHKDPEEGIRAFMEKREPRWEIPPKARATA
jgi:cyclohexa-1,5-dienecarbonyl-CoA hydratase